MPLVPGRLPPKLCLPPSVNQDEFATCGDLKATMRSNGYRRRCADTRQRDRCVYHRMRSIVEAHGLGQGNPKIVRILHIADRVRPKKKKDRPST
mmetsp:Transcript_26790/g.51955  ORF Transcript_26790/g.51955 Transcript_26790/m.51955 type:complete len:94 (+) Transcript_26790:159-440(+)